jgi:hypothetical protein
MTPRQIARSIVNDIAEDIRDRKGLGNEFEEIDEDIRLDMINSWLDITERRIKEYDRS